MSKKEVIIVVGLPGSGKSTAACILKTESFDVVELGDIWRELLKKYKIPRNDPRATREFSHRIREKEGKDVFARYAFKKIRKNENKVVIMGVRSTYEIDYLKKHIRKFYVLAILSPLKTRFKRLRERSKPEDPRSLADLMWLENREKQGFMTNKKEEKHGIMHVIRKADYIIYNIGTTAHLKKDIEVVLREIAKRN